MTVREQIKALEDGHGILDLEDWDATEVRGSEAKGWLNDLVTASIQGFSPGETVRSLLLGATGRIRADLHVTHSDRGFLLLQGPGQPDPIAAILAPYVLSSDVELVAAGRDGLAVTPRPAPRWGVARDGD